MHELGITEEIIDIALRHAGAEPIRRIVVEIGRDTAVLPDAVRFCFDLCAEDTPVRGAQLEILELPGTELRVRSVEVGA
jgi:hydrogenase nickel incorporation protein HypA/HybF